MTGRCAGCGGEMDPALAKVPADMHPCCEFPPGPVPAGAAALSRPGSRPSPRPQLRVIPGGKGTPSRSATRRPVETVRDRRGLFDDADWAGLGVGGGKERTDAG